MFTRIRKQARKKQGKFPDLKILNNCHRCIDIIYMCWWHGVILNWQPINKKAVHDDNRLWRNGCVVNSRWKSRPVSLLECITQPEEHYNSLVTIRRVGETKRVVSTSPSRHCSWYKLACVVRVKRDKSLCSDSKKAQQGLGQRRTSIERVVKLGSVCRLIVAKRTAPAMLFLIYVFIDYVLSDCNSRENQLL